MVIEALGAREPPLVGVLMMGTLLLQNVGAMIPESAPTGEARLFGKNPLAWPVRIMGEVKGLVIKTS